MFLGCYHLNNISDISKWKFNNLISMDCMFLGSNLRSIDMDTSNWNKQNLIKKNKFIFFYKKSKDNNKTRIFGKEFVKNNKDKWYLIIYDEINEINEFYDLNYKDGNFILI